MTSSKMTPVDQAALDRKVLWKLDIVLVPMMTMLYLLAFLDRANIGNARVAGLQKDLGITDVQYQTAITVTYVPYIASKLPSNLLLQKIGPRILLPLLCVCWGIVTTLQCLIHSYEGLLACRAVLGLVEGGLFPGIVLYLSSFYRRHELQMRIGLFYGGAALSGAFSGLLAAGIVNMHGIGGLKGWQWIFCLEGIFTTLFGLCSFLVLPNNPHQLRLLNREETEHCVRRLEDDHVVPDAETINPRTVLSTFKDFHVWLISATLFCCGCCLFGLAYFSPSIVQSFGYSLIKTQLLTVPPFVLAFVITLISAYYSDRYQARGIATICTSLLALVGAVMIYLGRSIATRYTATFLLISGVYASAPCLISWVPNNTAGPVRRATAVAMAFISTNIGGIVSTWMYPGSSAPYYVIGATVNVTLICCMVVLTAIQIFWLKRLNKQKVESREQILQGLEHLSQAEQLTKLGDKHPEFKYTY
ncbi:MFS general substrate transporter [Trichoderma velutinum]